LSPGVSGKRFTQSQTALTPFPFRWNTKLTYGVNVALGTSGSSPLAVKHRLALNGLYDPDITGTGHQPYQYDQMIAIYTKYLVRHAYVSLTFSNPSAAGLWVGWSVHTNTTSNDDPAGDELSSLIERPNFVCVPVSSAGNQAVTCEMKVPLAEIFGISQSQYETLADVYGAAYSANPVSLIYLDLFICDPNSLVSAQYVRVVGRIVFDAQFYDYAAPAQS
jgi:hypothetical protein